MRARYIESNYPNNYPHGHIIIESFTKDDDDILREFLNGASKNDLVFSIQNYGCECGYNGITQNHSFMFGFRKIETHEAIAKKISAFVYDKRAKGLLDRIRLFLELLKICLMEKFQ